MADYGAQQHNADVSLYRFPVSTCDHPIGASNDTIRWHSDWVAFDNNAGRLPVGNYAATYVGGDIYQQFVAGNSVLATNEPTVDQPVGIGASWIADIHDVWMTGGNSYTFKVTGGFSAMDLLRSTSDSSTWTKTKDTANAKLVLNPGENDNLNTGGTDKVRTGTLTLHDVNINSWYGFLVVRDAFWGQPTTVRVSVSTP